MDPIGDMFTRIRNGQLRLLTNVEMPSSNFRLKVLEDLKNEGFISSYHIEKKDNKKVSLIVDLKYYEGIAVIKEIKREFHVWFPFDNFFCYQIVFFWFLL